MTAVQSIKLYKFRRLGIIPICRETHNVKRSLSEEVLWAHFSQTTAYTIDPLNTIFLDSAIILSSSFKLIPLILEASFSANDIGQINQISIFFFYSFEVGTE